MVRTLWMFVAVAAAIAVATPHVEAGGLKHIRADRQAREMAAMRPWHGEYYHTASGYPVPLVVPPTARMQTDWSWGVSQSEVTPIYHQFRRSYYGDEMTGETYHFQPTPAWPSHTRQFGVYYVRGPW